MAAILSQLQCVKPPGAETGIFQENYVSTMGADALAPSVTRSSATMLLTMQDEEFLVFHENSL